MKYPEKIRVKFRPTPEMCRYRGSGIDTFQRIEWEVDREVGIDLIRYYSDNWALVNLAPDAEHPLVSAVMPTCSGREKMARYAVEQFKRQTWPSKQLIIVNEGTGWVTEGGDDDIVEVRVHPGSYQNGGLHNIGDGIATGDYIIRWDDDDIHHPDRIRVQAEGAIITASPCSTLGRRIHYFLDEDMAFIRETSSVGLILYRNEGKQYADGIRGGTDEMFHTLYYRQNTTKLDNWPGLYVRVYHGINQICDRRHCLSGNGHLKPGEWDVGDCAEYLREAITEYKEAIR